MSAIRLSRASKRLQEIYREASNWTSVRRFEWGAIKDKATAERAGRAESWLAEARAQADRGGAALPTAAAFAGSVLRDLPSAAAVRVALEVSASLVPIERSFTETGGAVWAARFVDGEKLIAIGGRSGALRILDSRSGKIVGQAKLDAGTIRALTVDPDHQVIWVGAQRGVVGLTWRGVQGQVELRIQKRAFEGVRVDALALDAKRNQLFVGATIGGELWSLPAAFNDPRSPKKETAIMDPRFVEDGVSVVPSSIYVMELRGDRLITVGIDGVVSVLAAGDPNKPLLQLTHPRSAFAAAVDAAGERIVLADADGGVSEYSLLSSKLIVSEQGVASPSSIAPSLERKLVAARVDREASSGGIAINPSDQIIGVTNHDGTVRFLTLESLAPVGLAVHREATRGVIFGTASALTFGDDEIVQVVRPLSTPEQLRIGHIDGFAMGAKGRIVAWPTRPKPLPGYRAPEAKTETHLFEVGLGEGGVTQRAAIDVSASDGLVLDDGTLVLHVMWDEGAPDSLGLVNYVVDRVVRRRTRQDALRDALRDWIVGDHSFDWQHPDDDFRALDATTDASVDFLVAGHTHLRRSLRRGCGHYFNSGTWSRLIQVNRAMLDDDQRYDLLYRCLMSRSLTDLDREEYHEIVKVYPTVVKIAAAEGHTKGWLAEVTDTGDCTPIQGSEAER